MAIDTLGANALASNSVTTAKIADDAVTTAKVDPAQTDITSLGTLTSITVGDGHTIGNQSVSDNLEFKSSSGENIVYNSENGSHIYYKNGVENFRINDDGEARFTDNIRLTTAGKGIYLGTTSATAANLLDDYEEGTYTPVKNNGGSVSYSQQRGYYIKVGRKVTVYVDIIISSASGESGITAVTLPFTSQSGGHNAYMSFLPWIVDTNFTGSDKKATGFINEGNAHMFMYVYSSENNSGSGYANQNTTGRWAGVFTYFTA